MPEHHDTTAHVTGAPRPAGHAGAQVRIALDSPPGPRWSRAFAARLTTELVGCPAVAHLRLDQVVQGAELVLDGVEPREAERLGPAVRAAIDAANAACAREPGEAPANMAQAEADAVAGRVASGVSP